MILTQASLEFWIKHVCQVEGQQTKGETRGRNLAPWACLWLDLPPLLAQRDGRHTSTEVTEKHELALRVLNGLRNYLVHGDLNARTRAEELVGTSGSEVLSHYVSGLMLQAADELFAYGIDHTGHLAPTKKRLLEMQPDLLS